MLQYYLAVWSLLLGLVIGSFLNVVIYRVPRHESLVRPGSHCPGCGSGIRWYDNIPVLSWLRPAGPLPDVPSLAYRPLSSGREASPGLPSSLRSGGSARRPAPGGVGVHRRASSSLAFIYHDHVVIPNRIVFPAAAVRSGCLSRSSILGTGGSTLRAALGAGLFAMLLVGARPGVARFSEVKMALLLGAVLGPYVLVALPVAVLLENLRANHSTFSPERPIKCEDGVGAVPGGRCSHGCLLRTTCVPSVRECVEPTGMCGNTWKLMMKLVTKSDAEVMRWL